MSKFIDVKPIDWFYNEVNDAARVYLEDGSPLIVGIPYNVFEPGKPYIYKEFRAEAGQTTYVVDMIIEPSNDSPLFVYIDGVQTIYKEVKAENGKTTITLFTGVRAGAVVAIASNGLPKTDEFGRPTQTGLDQVNHPSAQLINHSNYYYNPYYRDKREYVYAFGKQLVRANIPSEKWSSDPAKNKDLLREYIGSNNDLYYISPDGTFYAPYNLNRVTCNIIYLTNEGYIKVNTEEITPVSPRVLHYNRVFPNAFITRAEAFVLIDRLRQSIYSRFTDSEAPSAVLDSTVVAYEGQRSVSVKGRYEKGSGELEVYLNDRKQRIGRDYKEYDGYTVVFLDPLEEGDIVHFFSERTKSLTLEDVGTKTKYFRTDTGEHTVVNGIVSAENPKEISWWAPHILAMEQEELSSGEPMVQGISVKASAVSDGLKTVAVNSQKDPINMGEGEQWFMPDSFITRAQTVEILNRFRKLMLEKFL